MTTIVQRFTFQSAHHLPWHQGRCHRVHGHGYVMEVGFIGPLNENGIVADFDDIQEMIQGTLIKKYDHILLNDFFPNPTAEILAAAFFAEIEKLWHEKKFSSALSFVRIWENDTSYAQYEKDKQ
jgi:6-pyruvoyltetrahydropterin/6-carboxytetrahydropterin synthase